MKAIYKPAVPILLNAIFFVMVSGARADETGFLNRTVKIGVDRFPAVVVMPQCRKNLWWTQDVMQEQALAAFEQSVKEFNGDPAQFYLTGLSMGGYGTWSLTSKNPGKFAARVPVCGGIRPPPRVNIPEANKAVDPNVDPYAEAAKKVGKTPVWIFHGGADPVVPPDKSRNNE